MSVATARGFCALLIVGAMGVIVPAAGAESRPAFVRRHGGLVGGAALDRLRRVTEPLARVGELPMTLGVLGVDTPGAWAWPSGQVYVSAGLLAALDDDAVRAAVAHEVGHLLDGGHLGPSALAAGSGEGDEARADALGCALLRTYGLDAGGMPRLLRHMAASAPPGPAAEALERRAARALARCGSG